MAAVQQEDVVLDGSDGASTTAAAAGIVARKRCGACNIGYDEDDAAFCKRCGRRLEVNDDAAAIPPVAPLRRSRSRGRGLLQERARSRTPQRAPLAAALAAVPQAAADDAAAAAAVAAAADAVGCLADAADAGAAGGVAAPEAAEAAADDALVAVDIPEPPAKPAWVIEKMRKRQLWMQAYREAEIIVDEEPPMPAEAQTEECIKQLQSAERDLSSRPQGRDESLFEAIEMAAGDEFLKHPHSDVRLWAARCLVEGFRIFAPDCPVDLEKVPRILELLNEQLVKLAIRPDAERMSLVAKAQKMRMFVLVFEMVESKKLLTELVRSSIRVLRCDALGDFRGVLYDLLRDLLLAAAGDLPPTAVASLVEELMPSHETSLARADVKKLLLHITDSISVGSNQNLTMQAINEYMKALLYAKSSARARRADIVEQMQDAYAAVYELFTLDASFVTHILPNLQADLKSEDVHRRAAATQLVGRLLAYHPQVPDRIAVALTQPMLRSRLHERFEDADQAVRLAAMDAGGYLLEVAAALLGEGPVRPGSNAAAIVEAAEAVREPFLQRCLDPSEVIRLKALHIAADVAESPSGLRLLDSVLAEIFARILDKKPAVRETCAQKAAELYAAHALPRVVAGDLAVSQRLAWIPRLLCEAYHVFVGGCLGFTTEIEFLIERNILGCGGGLNAQERALAFLAFRAAVSDHQAARQGFLLIFQRKSDMNRALRRYLELRIAHAAPVSAPADGPGRITAYFQRTGDKKPPAGPEAVAMLTNLPKLSPVAEERSNRLEMMEDVMMTFDNVLDASLFTLLEDLCGCGVLDTGSMPTILSELDRLLTVNELRELEPLLRRAMLTTWLLPEQLKVIQLLVTGKPPDKLPQANARKWQQVALDMLPELAKFFPSNFLPHLDLVAESLTDDASDTAFAALRCLAAIGKRLQLDANLARALEDARLPLEAKKLTGWVMGAVSKLGDNAQTRDKVCRKAVRVVKLMPRTQWRPALGEILAEAEKLQTSVGGAVPDYALAMHLAAACYDCDAECSAEDVKEDWLERGRCTLQTLDEAQDDELCAAAELIVMAGGEPAIMELLTGIKQVTARVSAYMVTSVLRALRHGKVKLTTALLSCLVDRIRDGLEQKSAIISMADVLPIQAAPMEGGSHVEADAGAAAGALAGTEGVTGSQPAGRMLQGLQKAWTAGLRLSLHDRLRLCVTLPTLYAQAPVRQQRSTAQQMLQTVLLRTVKLASVRKEPLIEVAVACFLHFLSRLGAFLEEAGAASSAYPESSRVCSLFVEALLKCEMGRPGDLGQAVLRVCERVRYFVDKEAPESEAVHKAGNVLRYVVEKRCPEATQKKDAAEALKPGGGMPAGLFILRGRTGVVPLPAPATGTSPLPLSSTPAAAAAASAASGRGFTPASAGAMPLQGPAAGSAASSPAARGLRTVVPSGAGPPSAGLSAARSPAAKAQASGAKAKLEPAALATPATRRQAAADQRQLLTALPRTRTPSPGGAAAKQQPLLVKTPSPRGGTPSSSGLPTVKLLAQTPSVAGGEAAAAAAGSAQAAKMAAAAVSSPPTKRRRRTKSPPTAPSAERRKSQEERRQCADETAAVAAALQARPPAAATVAAAPKAKAASAVAQETPSKTRPAAKAKSGSRSKKAASPASASKAAKR
eukprot:TRINITY_DN49944_c0_g1_i3.p1 TRINITY_DN49944_c0_g1~~TRINITY_DN49944_c0_g1_i3.p1  ORF type:complete len:1675 (-),score=485.79 TRINITY_DN49944_c0_g1_i3:112-5073(-)